MCVRRVCKTNSNTGLLSHYVSPFLHRDSNPVPTDEAFQRVAVFTLVSMTVELSFYLIFRGGTYTAHNCVHNSETLMI